MTPAPATAAVPRASAERSRRRPRRISGPVRPASRAYRHEAQGTGAGVIAAPAGLRGRGVSAAPAGPAHVIGGARGSLVAHRLLDRLLRGRLWIAVVSFALIGIVAMQLWVLKLNSGIGRAIEHEALLQRENAALSIEDSALASGFKAEARAAGAGMVPIPPGSVTFLRLRGRRDVREAARVLKQPLQSASTSAFPAGAAAGSEAAPATSTAVPVGQEPSVAQSSPATPTPEGQTASAPTEATGATAQTEAATPAAGVAESTTQGAPAAGATGTAVGATGAAAGAGGTATSANGTTAGEVSTPTEGLDTGGQATPGPAEPPVNEAAGGVPR